MMGLIPDWAPNLHPMIVHFPIALLFLAFVFDLLSLIKRDSPWFRYAATSTYIAGGLGAIATYFSGRQAVDTVTLPPLANPVLTDHADLALITMLTFIIYAIMRFIFLWKSWDRILWVSIILLIIGFAGLGLLFKTAEHGAELVYRYGVGVMKEESIQNQEEKINTKTKGIKFYDNGSWQWQVENGAPSSLMEEFEWIKGNLFDMDIFTIEDEKKGIVLSINARDSILVFTAGNPLTSIQADIEVNLNEFKGDFMIVHHFSSLKTFDFVSINAGNMILGRKQGGRVEKYDEDKFNNAGWITLRAVGDGTHFRGYVNEKLVTHGHASELKAGTVGLYINGMGNILLKSIDVKSLRND